MANFDFNDFSIASVMSAIYAKIGLTAVDVYDGLDSYDTSKALSALQGKILANRMMVSADELPFGDMIENLRSGGYIQQT